MPVDAAPVAEPEVGDAPASEGVDDSDAPVDFSPPVVDGAEGSGVDDPPIDGVVDDVSAADDSVAAVVAPAD